MKRVDILERLSASRPKGQDDVDPHMAEAFQEAQVDPELREWLEQEREVDCLLAAKLSSVKVPAGLKEKILTASKIIPVPVWRQPALWAAAAVLITALAGLSWLGRDPQPAGVLSFQQYQQETVTFARHFWYIPHKSPELADIRAWLTSAHAPADFSVPPKLEALKALGCRTLTMQGNTVSLICFKLEDGKTEAHLFVVNRSALQDVPPENTPAMARQNGWSTASWSDSQRVYILASTATPETLQKFF